MWEARASGRQALKRARPFPAAAQARRHLNAAAFQLCPGISYRLCQSAAIRLNPTAAFKLNCWLRDATLSAKVSFRERGTAIRPLPRSRPPFIPQWERQRRLPIKSYFRIGSGLQARLFSQIHPPPTPHARPF